MEKITTANKTDIVNKLKSAFNVPYSCVYVSTLGGIEKASIIIKLSLDDTSQWNYSIYENSLYFSFHLDYTGELETISKSYKIEKKFRKCTVKTIDEAIIKINKYIKEIS
jgi:hypothetical protein